MAKANIEINMDAKCADCGKPGACPNGLCLACSGKRMMGKPETVKYPDSDGLIGSVVKTEKMAGMMANQLAKLIWANALEIGAALDKEYIRCNDQPRAGELTVKLSCELYQGRRLCVKSQIGWETKEKVVKECGLETYDPDQPELPGIAAAEQAPEIDASETMAEEDGIIEIEIPLPKKLKARARVMLRRIGDGWSCGWGLDTKKGGRAVPPDKHVAGYVDGGMAFDDARDQLEEEAKRLCPAAVVSIVNFIPKEVWETESSGA